MKFILCLVFSFLFILFSLFGSEADPEKESLHRAIILTDIEADPDDAQSLVRLMVYANQIDLKGIVATTSCWQRNQIHPESIRKTIRAYGAVRENLLLHEQGYPAEAQLLSLVKQGLPVYGMLGVGDGKSSEGSDWIIEELEKDDPRPLWIPTWGGINTLAQALWDIRASKSETEADALYRKLRIYAISDQDDSGIWIRENFPEVFYIVTPGDDYGGATWTAINSSVQDWSNEEISNAWIAANIQQGHGPLGVAYPDVAWGMEGDTPSFLGLISNGLNVPETPNYGGWGGRYEFYQPELDELKGSANSGVPNDVEEPRAIWTNANDSFTPCVANAYGRTIKRSEKTFTGFKETLWRWRKDFQNDFAARMDWCVKSYVEANHPPIVKLSHPNEMVVHSGDSIRFEANESYDPDGDSISFLWFHYPEAGTWKEEIRSGGAENEHKFDAVMPVVTQKETAHFILKVTDRGIPSLTRYQRIIVTILPNE